MSAVEATVTANHATCQTFRLKPSNSILAFHGFSCNTLDSVSTAQFNQDVLFISSLSPDFLVVKQFLLLRHVYGPYECYFRKRRVIVLDTVDWNRIHLSQYMRETKNQ